MSRKVRMIVGLVASLLLIAAVVPLASADPVVDKEAVSKGFAALADYDWGKDRAPLAAIEVAVSAAHDDDAAQKEMEARLIDVIKSNAPRGAKDFACRQLSLVGAKASVPVAAALLTDESLSHMGRYVLERVGGADAAKALRDALPKVKGRMKVGVINSLGVMRDADSTAALVALLGDADPQVAGAAAAALGAIGTSESAKALGDFQKKAPEKLQLAVADACLTCAEQLLAGGKKAEAMLIYKSLSASKLPKHIKMAAMRGMLAATGKKK